MSKALRPQLVVFRDEDGAELFDLPEAPRPNEDTPAPVRFLYDYDNLLLSHANRSRMAGYDTSVLGTARNGILPNFVLIDGTVRAAWTLRRDKRAATLGIRLLGAISAAQREELATEAAASPRTQRREQAQSTSAFGRLKLRPCGWHAVAR